MIRLTCDACGGSLEIEPGQKVMMCPFCGSKFIEKNVTNNYNIANGQINAAEVNINADTLAKDTKLKAAEGHLRLGNYELAFQLLQDLALYYPEDVDVRVAMFKSVSLNGTRNDYNKAEFEVLDKCYSIIENFDPDRSKELWPCYNEATGFIESKKEAIGELYLDSDRTKDKAKTLKATSDLFIFFIVFSILALLLCLASASKLGFLVGLFCAVSICGFIMFRVESKKTSELAVIKRSNADEDFEEYDSDEIRF